MLLRLPHSLHYPITVTELLKQPNDHVERFAPLFSYFYKTTVTEGDELGNEYQVEKTFPSRFESNVEGVLKKWKIKQGTVITRAKYVHICRQTEWCCTDKVTVWMWRKLRSHAPTRSSSVACAPIVGKT